MSTYDNYPRDLAGYGRNPPHPAWPGRARIALQFVLNYEEGGENSVLHGDPASETFLSEIIGAPAFPMRHMSMESLYEYGSRAGLWRLLRMFERRRLPLTVFGVAMASSAIRRRWPRCANWATKSPATAWKWISYQNVDQATERAQWPKRCIMRELTGAAWLVHGAIRPTPAGGGRARRLRLPRHYGDDLPFWGTGRSPAPMARRRARQRSRQMVPYALDSNDMRFAAIQGFNSGTQFFDYLKDAFDVL
jgi:peptidoglycan/xylan/chitin deacetylase (PgdA/CDA1 family)